MSPGAIAVAALALGCFVSGVVIGAALVLNLLARMGRRYREGRKR